MDERLYTKQEVSDVLREAFRREETSFRELLASHGVPGLSLLIGALEYAETVALHALDLLDRNAPSP